MAFDFSKPETKAIFEAEVKKRMEEPFFMSRSQAEMLVAVLMTEPLSQSPQADATPESEAVVGRTR